MPFNQSNIYEYAKFVYFGLQENFQKIVDLTLHPDNEIHLSFNVDGVSPFKSSFLEIRPILAHIHTNPSAYRLFPMCMNFGKGKPKLLNLFFNDFIAKLNVILANGIVKNNQNIKVRVLCFICDRPARVFLKCTVGHTGFSLCERCIDRGFRFAQRTLFATDISNTPKRTDESFRNKVNSAHHKGDSPLLRITQKLDMVKDFFLDFMHLGCFGVMKKLIELWTSPTMHDTKLDNVSLLRISSRLTNLSHQLPTKFQQGNDLWTSYHNFNTDIFYYLVLLQEY